MFIRFHSLKYCFSQSYAELIASTKQSRIIDVANLKQLLDNLYQKKPAMHCIIFNEAGHPLEKQTNEIYNNVANKYHGYTFYRINLSNEDKVAQFFGVRHPQSLFVYGLGQPLTKHIGAGQNKLEQKLQIAQEHLQKADILEGTGQWEGPQDLWRTNYDEEQGPFDYYAR